MRFLYPQKPRHIHDVSVVPKNYFFQIKKNGWRAEIMCDSKFVINNREGSKLSRGDAEMWRFLEKIFPKPFYLDGELVGTRQAGKSLNHIVIWDVPILGGKDLTRVAYIDRYNELLKLADVNSAHLNASDTETFGTLDIAINDNYKLLLSMNFEQKEYRKFWDVVVKEEIKNRPSLPVNEGLVFKNPGARDLWDLYKTKEKISQLKLRTV